MDEQMMEKYADWLDDLEKNDPESYKQLLTTMQTQMLASGMTNGMPNDPTGAKDSSELFFDLLKKNSNVPTIDPMMHHDPTMTNSSQDFTPRFPGNKVMETSGLQTKQEGIYIDVEPGFVMKTSDLKKKTKIFVNFCFSNDIQTFSTKKKLDEEGKEQEGIHVPLSLGAPHEVIDKSGKKCLAFDVAVNTQVIEDCKQDKTGAFRNFVCELAIQYIDQKYKIQLDARYKLPRLKYSGELPPPQHYIRKIQAPVIQEVSSSTTSTSTTSSSSSSSNTKLKSKVTTTLPPAEIEKTRHITYDIMEYKTSYEDIAIPTTRTCVVEGGKQMSKEEFHLQSPYGLKIQCHFLLGLADKDIALEIQPETISLKAKGHFDLFFYLPFPLDINSCQAKLEDHGTLLTLKALVEKKTMDWYRDEPDIGSKAWLLVQALDDNADADPKDIGNDQEVVSKSTTTSNGTNSKNTKKAKSLLELFHLEDPDTNNNDVVVEQQQKENHATTQRKKWDPVEEDEEVPEDRFHRKDMMSLHILEQRRKEKEEKKRHADQQRQLKKKEIEKKKQEAQKAGKTWSEMYPNEPETTFIDFDEIVKEQKQEQVKQQQEKLKKKDFSSSLLSPSETAKERAALWSKQNASNLQSTAMAFELL